MSAISALALADGQSTPVSHTFEVVTAQAGSDIPARWAEKTAGVYAGYLQITQLVRRTSNRSTKVQLKVTTPKLSTDGLNSLVHTGIATVDFTIPDTMSIQERKDLSRYVANALDNTIVRDAIENMSPAY